MKLKENFKNFLKKYEENKKFITKIKIQEFIEEQDTMIDNINERIDDVISKTDEENGSRPSKRIRKEKLWPRINSLVNDERCKVPCHQNDDKS